jgi:hypothetical protein
MKKFGKKALTWVLSAAMAMTLVTGIGMSARADTVAVTAAGEKATYTITNYTDANGTVTADQTTASAGATVTLTAAPATGYGLSALTAGDAKLSAAVSSNTAKYTFTMPAANVTLKAAFSPIALTVYARKGSTGKKVQAAQFTKEELAAAATTSAKGYGYVYYKDKTANAVVATQVVTLDTLLDAAGLSGSWTSGSTLAFTCTDGEYTKANPSYQDIQDGCYYVDETGSAKVPAGIALKWTAGSLKDGTVADLAAKAVDTAGLRFVCGMTAAQYKDMSAAGKRMPSGVTAMTVTYPPVLSFTDVKSGDWWYNAVNFVTAKGLFNGSSDTKFAPNSNMSRSQLISVLYRMAGSPEVKGTCAFKDVAASSYCCKAVIWGAANGIVNGTGKTTFNPNGNVSRQQIAMFLYRYAQMMKYDTTQGGMAIRDFADYAKISAGAMNAMTWAVNADVMHGSGNRLNPQASATRAEVAALLMNFCQKFVH